MEIEEVAPAVAGVLGQLQEPAEQDTQHDFPMLEVRARLMRAQEAALADSLVHMVRSTTPPQQWTVSLIQQVMNRLQGEVVQARSWTQ